MIYSADPDSESDATNIFYAKYSKNKRGGFSKSSRKREKVGFER